MHRHRNAPVAARRLLCGVTVQRPAYLAGERDWLWPSRRAPLTFWNWVACRVGVLRPVGLQQRFLVLPAGPRMKV
jgi:hypothetical protein